MVIHCEAVMLKVCLYPELTGKNPRLTFDFHQAENVVAIAVETTMVF